MGLFTKKKAAVTAAETASSDDQPKPEPYRHIPSHAAADSMGNGGQNIGTFYDRQRIEAEGRRRMKFAIANESNASDSAYLQAMARGNLPRSNSSLSQYSANTPRGPLSRNSSGYFTPSMPHIVDTDEDVDPQSGKLGVDGQALHWSSDSGYNSATPSSAINSRTPSEHGKLESEALEASSTVKRADSYLSISVPPVNEAELSETSSDDAPVEMAPKKAHKSALKVRRASPASEDDLNADAQSIRSVRSTRSTNGKQTRFEQPNEAVPPMPTQHRQEYIQQRRNKEQGRRTPSPTADVPVSTLEGYKVNSKGQILNEEAELLGELVSGDLLECVRQRIDSLGNVVDAAGNVVGKVQVVSRTSDATFAYHGDIPAADSPFANFMHQRSTSAIGAKTMPPAFQRHASTGMLVLNSMHMGPAAGRRGAPYAMGVPTRPSPGGRVSYTTPARRSPLASQEHSPTVTREEDDLTDIPEMPISRALSIRTTASGRTLQPMEPKTRTYFTHGGKVTLATGPPGSPMSDATAKIAAPATALTAETAIDASKSDKRKSRFSAMFGKKK